MKNDTGHGELDWKEAVIPDYANYPETGYPPPVVEVNGRVRIPLANYVTAKRVCSECGREFYHHAIMAYINGKPICPPCQKKAQDEE